MLFDGVSMDQSKAYEAIVVGGSYAGLAAATQLARARRRILVIDSGQRRNRFADHSHGFLTQDGTPAAEIAAQARAQLMAYDTVDWEDAGVSSAVRTSEGFQVQWAGQAGAQAQRLVLAYGVKDQLPPVPGLAERWGRSVFHCPYCHGYELQQGRIGVLAVSALSLHQALLLPDWGQTTLFLNEAFEPSNEERAKLAQRGVTIEPVPVAEIRGQAEIVLADGRVIAQDGVFTMSRIVAGSTLAQDLGCEIEETPMGPRVVTKARQATSVPGVFACGDLARPAGSVALAVGDGTMAGVAAHQSLVFGLEG